MLSAMNDDFQTRSIRSASLKRQDSTEPTFPRHSLLEPLSVGNIIRIKDNLLFKPQNQLDVNKKVPLGGRGDKVNCVLRAQFLSSDSVISPFSMPNKRELH